MKRDACRPVNRANSGCRHTGADSGLPWLPCHAWLLIAVLSLPFIPFPVVSQNRPLDGASIVSLKSHIREVAQKTKTISCDFVQEKEMSMISEKIVSRGQFYLKKEKMLRWEYSQPFSYVIIIHGDEISIRDENKVSQFSMQSNKVFAEINRVILGSLQGTLLDDEKNFKATFFAHQTAWVVKLQTLTPKLKEFLHEIVIWFDRDEYTVSRLDMNESSGDLTRITFTSKKINQPIADEKFMVR